MKNIAFDYEFGIIGAGFGGLIAAIRLQKEGIFNFVLFERANAIGGTWRDNIYPGCACDVPSILYSIKDAPNPHWNNLFSSQSEILSYMHEVVAKHNLQEKIRLNCDIVDIAFDEESAIWHITNRAHETFKVKRVLLANGPLNRAVVPDIRGLHDFKGNYFHSNSWDSSIDLNEKKVGIIGTGASAIQIIPSIVNKVKSLHVFQRTPAWVLPRGDKRLSTFVQQIFERFPFVQKIVRSAFYWLLEFMGLAFIGNNLMYKLNEKMGLHHLRKQVKNVVTREKLTPKYKIGCKRVLRSDDYYPCFNRDNVYLNTNEIVSITDSGVITQANELIEVDVLIFATGFNAADIDFYMAIKGLHGESLTERWKQTGAEAYKSTLVQGFPNLYIMLGPNSGLGHNSVLHIMESQMEQVMAHYKHSSALQDSVMDVHPEAMKKYNIAIQSKFSDTVWASGCKSWYMNKNGKIIALFPRLSYAFRKVMKKFEANDYTIVKLKERNSL